MARHPDRHRLAPYKMLMCLLYGHYSWIHLTATPGYVEVDVSAACLFFRYRHSQFYRHIAWLHEYGYIGPVTKVRRARIGIELLAPTTLTMGMETHDNLEGRVREQLSKLRALTSTLLNEIESGLVHLGPGSKGA